MIPFFINAGKAVSVVIINPLSACPRSKGSCFSREGPAPTTSALFTGGIIVVVFSAAFKLRRVFINHLLPK